MKTRALVFAIGVVGIISLSNTLAASPTLGPNLAPNPSFESGTGTQPDDWIPNPNATNATFFWDTTFGRTGTSSVRLSTSQRFVILSNPGWISSGFIPIEPNRKYQASVFTYTPDGGVGHILAIQFFEEDGTFLGTIGATGPSGFADPTGVWVEKIFTFDLSTFSSLASATKVRLIVVQDIETTQGTVTTVFFDDVYFGKILEITPVTIDIKPGSDPNAINPANSGLISVVILSTETFDATTVSPITVQFGPTGASPQHELGHLEDVDNDGDLDLVLHFRSQATGIQCGDTEASLTGETFDGQPIQGADSIVTVGCS